MTKLNCEVVTTKAELEMVTSRLTQEQAACILAMDEAAEVRRQRMRTEEAATVAATAATEVSARHCSGGWGRPPCR